MTFLILFLVNVGASFLVAEMGRGRRIGYTNLLLIGILFSFALALFVALVSPYDVSDSSYDDSYYYNNEADELEFTGRTLRERISMQNRYGDLLQKKRNGEISNEELSAERYKLIKEWETGTQQK